jgi:hypothetical protein
MIAFIVLFTVLYGYLAHQTRRFVYERFGNGWRELVSYSLGVLLVFPVFAFVIWLMCNDDVRRELMTREDYLKRGVLAYFLAFLPFGLGTFAGWLLDGGNGTEI